MALVLPLFLIGLGAIAFPLYFHLKRSKGVEIEVPSLLLFTQFKLVKPRSGEKHYLLLLARLLLLIILSLMMTRPFIESDKKLSLPLLVDETSHLNYLGIVLDDSLTSMQSAGLSSKFDQSKQQVLKILEQYSDDTAVYLCLTSNAVPIGPLTVAKCQEMLKSIKPLNSHGSAFSALKALTVALDGKKGRIVVATSKNKHLWRDSEKLNPSYIDFLESDGLPSPMIREITCESTPGFSILKITLADLRDDSVITVYNEITGDILSEVSCKNRIIRVGVSGQSGLPVRVELKSGDRLFGSRYLTLDLSSENSSKVLVVGQQKFAVEVVKTAINSFAMDLTVETTQRLPKLDNYSVIISADGSFVNELIKRQPSPEQTTIVFANAKTSSNLWDNSVVSNSYEFTRPEQLSAEFNWRAFNSLPSSETFELTKPSELWQNILVNQDGLSSSILHDAERKVVVGLPLTSQDSSWVYHPSFLFFLQEFVIKKMAEDRQLLVGNSELANTIFGDFSTASFSKLGEKPVVIDRKSDIYFYEPGIYQLKQNLITRYYPVNFSTFNTELFSPDELENLLGLKIIDSVLQQKTWRIGSTNSQQLYDLAPLVILLILALFAFEEFALIITWFRKRL